MRLCVLVTASCSSLVVLARVPGRERSLSLGRAEIACGPLLTWTEAVAGLMLPTPAGARYVICVCVVRVASDHIHTSLGLCDDAYPSTAGVEEGEVAAVCSVLQAAARCWSVGAAASVVSSDGQLTETNIQLN